MAAYALASGARTRRWAWTAPKRTFRLRVPWMAVFNRVTRDRLTPAVFLLGDHGSPMVCALLHGGRRDGPCLNLCVSPRVDHGSALVGHSLLDHRSRLSPTADA